MGGEEIGRDLPSVSEAVGQFRGEAGLTLARGHGAVERRRPDLRVIEVRLELPLTAGRRRIRVHLDLEAVLSGTPAGHYREQREDGKQDMAAGRCSRHRSPSE